MSLLYECNYVQSLERKPVKLLKDVKCLSKLSLIENTIVEDAFSGKTDIHVWKSLNWIFQNSGLCRHAVSSGLHTCRQHVGDGSIENQLRIDKLSKSSSISINIRKRNKWKEKEITLCCSLHTMSKDVHTWTNLGLHDIQSLTLEPQSHKVQMLLF